mgnify:CR=1 FL=1
MSDTKYLLITKEGKVIRESMNKGVLILEKAPYENMLGVDLKIVEQPSLFNRE